MATTDSGVTVPSGADAFDPQGDMVALGNSLDGQVIATVANATEAEAYATALAADSVVQAIVYRLDATAGRNLEYCQNTASPTVWTPVASAGAAGTPFAQAAGAKTGVGPTAQTSFTTAVTFPASRFTVAPIIDGIVSTASAGAAGGWSFRAVSITTSGFTIVGNSGDGAADTWSGDIHWSAKQMTATTAAG